jgi:hypothetical protein
MRRTLMATGLSAHDGKALACERLLYCQHRSPQLGRDEANERPAPNCPNPTSAFPPSTYDHGHCMPFPWVLLDHPLFPPHDTSASTVHHTSLARAVRGDGSTVTTCLNSAVLYDCRTMPSNWNLPRYHSLPPHDADMLFAASLAVTRRDEAMRGHYITVNSAVCVHAAAIVSMPSN